MKKIKLTRSEASKLSHAVRTFNKEVEKHMQEGNIKALPKLIDYKDMKDRILTRKDFNLALSTLKKIKNKNAFNLERSINNPNVEYIHWTKETAKRYDFSYRKNLLKELEGIKKEQLKYAIPEKVGNQTIYKATMGSTRERQIESYLNNPNIRLFEGADSYMRLSNIFDRMQKLAFDSSVIDRAKIYKENYLRMFEGYENENFYSEIIKKIRDMKPMDFFEWARRNDEHYDDFAFHYDNGMVQSSFNQLAESLGVDTSSYDEWSQEELDDFSSSFLDTL